MRPYLASLIERLADKTPFQSSDESISFAAHREAGKLDDITMVDELAQAVPNESSKWRRVGCYVTIGAIGRNLKDPRCASVLLGLLPGEKEKYNIASLLQSVGEIPKPPEFDLAPVFALLGDDRWLVRHAAIRALENTSNPEAEVRLVKHLSATDDPHDQVICHSVLNHIGTPRSIPTIRANLKSRKRDVKLSAEAAIVAIKERHDD
jgi:HEAT repeat protein